MRRIHCKLQIAITCVLALVTHLPVDATPFSFDDIEFWVGDGANRAALVIDWVENSTKLAALVWGYRWDGSADGSDMLAAVVAADPRLFAKLGGTRVEPAAVYGLGYDADNDGEFGLDDGTQFDGDGFAFTGPADLATATDPDDYYAEGWFTGFWHYGEASANPYDGGSWSDTPVGMAGRNLADGSWDSWAFSPSFDFAAFAENPEAAPPPGALPGDFNGDGRVDAADYSTWSSTFGSTSELAADGNGNQVVDAADYVLWRAHASPSPGAYSSPARNVPEPSAASLLVACLLAQFFVLFNHQNLGGRFMTHRNSLLAGLLCSTLLSGTGQKANAQYAAVLVSYDSGATPAAGFTTASAAMGEPERYTGEGVFPGVVSPFNPPYLSSEIVSVGEGGQITLRLSHYAIPQAVGPEIGVFGNVGLIDIDYPNGQAGSPAATFGPLDSAAVEVSADGSSWVSLGSVVLDVPTNGYTDLTDPFLALPGSVPSDFQQPFTGNLSSFDGLSYFDAGGPDMLDLLAGSGGGTWLDISGTGLAKVGYIRFSIADDGLSGTILNFELDAVSIAHAAQGPPIIPEPATIFPMMTTLICWLLSARPRFSCER